MSDRTISACLRASRNVWNYKLRCNLLPILAFINETRRNETLLQLLKIVVLSHILAVVYLIALIHANICCLYFMVVSMMKNEMKNQVCALFFTTVTAFITQHFRE